MYGGRGVLPDTLAAGISNSVFSAIHLGYGSTGPKKLFSQKSYIRVCMYYMYLFLADISETELTESGY